MNKLKVLFGSILLICGFLITSYPLEPLPHPVCIAYLKAPLQTVVGRNVTFDASSSFCYLSGSTIRVPITNYLFTFGDGASSSGLNPTAVHTYGSVGTYTATVTVSAQGWQSSASTKISVLESIPETEPPIYMPQPPIPCISCIPVPPIITSFNANPQAGNEPLTVSFFGSALDLNNDSMTYTLFFKWNQDNSLNTTGAISPTPKLLGTFTYAAGTYLVRLEVSDGKNKTSRTLIMRVNTSTPVNLLPSVDFSYLPTEVFVGDSVSFNDASNDPDGEIVSWFWDFGDGFNSTDSDPTHTYTSAGTYTVSLRVYDNQNGTNSTSKNIEVKVRPIPNEPPIAQFWGNASSGVVPFDVKFDGSYSYDADGYLTCYQWTVTNPDGSKYVDYGCSDPYTGFPPSFYQFIYHFNTSGKYQVSLTVWDNENASTTKERDVFAFDYRLIINAFTADPSAGTEPLPVTFNVDFTGQTPVNYTLFYDINNRLLNRSGELNSTIASLGNYTYTTAGDYAAELILSNEFANATITTAIHVSAVVPPAPGGGGGGGMYLTQPAPIIKTSGITYLGFHPSLALNGTREYSYNPTTNQTTIIFKLTNLANFNRTLLIRDLITKDMAASMMDVQVIPVPHNIYNADPDIGWNVTLKAHETFTIKYVFNKYIPFASFDAMPLPNITELKVVSGVPTEVPVSPTAKVTVPGGITGFVITTLSNPWAGVIIVVVILVLFFTSSDAGRRTWGTISKKTNKLIASIAEELEEPEEYKEKSERVRKLKKLMKKKR